MFFRLLITGFLILCVYSCAQDSFNNDPIIELAEKTIIVYMVADNNLDYFAEKNIIEMQKGWTDLDNVHLIVYIDRADGARPSHPIILDIKNDSVSVITSPVVKSYPETNSCNSDHMKQVIEDIVELYPAKKYGLILWSHGTSWFPKEHKDNLNEVIQQRKNKVFTELDLPLTKSFGLDNNFEMNIDELEKAIPFKFDFIIFDACFMGSIEVIYELKAKARYIIASSAEVISYGFPYQSMFPFLVSDNYRFSDLCQDYVNYYNKKEGVLATGTIAVINTENLNKLTNITKQIFQEGKALSHTDISSFQQFDLDKSNKIFDLSELMTHISVNDNLLEQYNEAIDNVIIYKGKTSKIWGSEIEHFSGLSVFIPSSLNNKYLSFYEKNSWYHASGYNLWNYN